MQLLTLFLFLSPSILFASTTCGDKYENLNDWLNCNEPIVVEYLRSLDKEIVGTEISGVKLKNGELRLSGYKLLGINKAIDSVESYIFSYTDSYNKEIRETYYWTELNLKNKGMFLLPSCNNRFGFPSNFVLSGDSYTYKYLGQKRIVIHKCIRFE